MNDKTQCELRVCSVCTVHIRVVIELLGFFFPGFSRGLQSDVYRWRVLFIRVDVSALVEFCAYSLHTRAYISMMFSSLSSWNNDMCCTYVWHEVFFTLVALCLCTTYSVVECLCALLSSA